jgi:hypothetical protein
VKKRASLENLQRSQCLQMLVSQANLRLLTMQNHRLLPVLAQDQKLTLLVDHHGLGHQVLHLLQEKRCVILCIKIILSCAARFVWTSLFNRVEENFLVCKL